MANKEVLGQIVGSSNVFDDPETLERYSKDMSSTRGKSPGYLVRPADAGEVEKLIKWANEADVALVPLSSGPPHFRGDTLPDNEGAVVVDLGTMKQIVRIDRKNRVAMIEPGVTFGELIPRLAAQGLRLNMPLLPRSTKSVIGSMLEREPVMMPLHQWDAIDPLSCIEVAFGSGEVFRTGSAAGPGTLEEQWRAGQAQVNPMGPGQTDFARVVQGAQGTMGIVTWASHKCEALPVLQEPFFVGAEKIEALVDFVYRLLWLKLPNECLILNGSDMAAAVTRNPEEHKALREALPKWVLFFCLAGYQYLPEERLAYQKNDMFAAAGQSAVEPVKSVAGVSADAFLARLAAPSEEPYWKLRFRGGFQDIFFLTTLDKVAKFEDLLFNLAKEAGFPFSDIGVYVQPMVQGSSCHCEFTLFHKAGDDDEGKKARAESLFLRASQALLEQGAFFSRPYGPWADMVYRKDGEMAAALKKAKSIFDPKGIMNTGKLCF
jgi:FAD/FMN-containing dehydrogenase